MVHKLFSCYRFKISIDSEILAYPAQASLTIYYLCILSFQVQNFVNHQTNFSTHATSVDTRIFSMYSSFTGLKFCKYLHGHGTMEQQALHMHKSLHCNRFKNSTQANFLTVQSHTHIQGWNFPKTTNSTVNTHLGEHFSIQCLYNTVNLYIPGSKFQ